MAVPQYNSILCNVFSMCEFLSWEKPKKASNTLQKKGRKVILDGLLQLILLSILVTINSKFNLQITQFLSLVSVFTVKNCVSAGTLNGFCFPYIYFTKSSQFAYRETSCTVDKVSAK